MKYLIKTLIVLLCVPYTGFSTDLQTAIKQNLVKAQFVGNGGHRAQCLKLLIENKSNKVHKIQIEPGTYLENEDTNRQDIIIVDNDLFVLQPKEKREIVLNGLCCKSRRSAPQKGGAFTIRKASTPAIVGLSKLLLELGEFKYAGQSALWNLVDNGDPNHIVGEDSVKTMKLRKYVGNALNKEVKPFIWTSYNRPATVVSNKLSITTQGNHYLREVNENDLIEYGIFNEADSAVSEVQSERVVANFWKKHNVKWKIELEDLNPTKKFYMRIMVNGVIKKEWMYYFWG